MNITTPIAANAKLLNSTGYTTITSGRCAILGVAFVGTATGGIRLFAGVTASASMTPMITFSATTSAVAGGLSPMYLPMPAVVSGTGLTVQNLASADPNLILYWSPLS